MIEVHSFPKGLMHPLCDGDAPGAMGNGHLHPDNTCAELDEQYAWRQIVNNRGLNADMLMPHDTTDDTDTDWVWTFDKPPPTPEEVASKAAAARLAAAIALLAAYENLTPDRRAAVEEIHQAQADDDERSAE